MWQASERGGGAASVASGVGVLASEASLPPEASQVVAEGDGLRVDHIQGHFGSSGEPIGRLPSKLGYRPNFSRQSIWAGHWAASSTKNVRF